MEVKEFEDLQISTMTLVIYLQGSVDLIKTFKYLPISNLYKLSQSQEPKRKIKKRILPHSSIPGDILSLRFDGKIRGFPGKWFKNAIALDVSIKSKNVSLKLSRSTIQMCGAKTLEDGVEVANYIITHLKFLENMLGRFRQEPEKTSNTLKWIEETTRGENILRDVKDIFPSSEVSEVELHVISKISDFKVQLPTIDTYNDQIDIDMKDFFLRYLHEFTYHSDYCNYLQEIRKIKTIITSDLMIDDIRKAMVNYHYSLGKEVDRYNLATFLNGYNIFFARFDNALQPHATIEVPYEYPEDSRFIRRKGKAHHTFLVYRSGRITQIGPGGELMKEVYNIFIQAMMEFFSIYDRS